MTLQVVTLVGPLDADRLRWVADVYGDVDPKYRDPQQLEHLFVAAPAAAPPVHAFALEDGRPVGHCAVVPMTARAGARRFVAGKVEALAVDARHRGRRDGAPPLAVELRRGLYAEADAGGYELLHAYVRPEVGRILELEPLAVGPRSLVGVLDPHAVAREREGRAAVAAVALAQGAVRRLAHIAAGASRAEVRRPTDADGDLVAVDSPPPGRWTILGDDTWEWHRRAPFLRVLELDGSRALVQLPGAPGDALRIAAWRAEEPSLRGALRSLLSAVHVARAHAAGTIRFQPWPGDASSNVFARACRVLGFVGRDDFGTLYVRARPREAAARADAVVWTPLLALGF